MVVFGPSEGVGGGRLPSGPVSRETAIIGREEKTGPPRKGRRSGGFAEMDGAPGGVRTHNLQLRRLTLYPLNYGRKGALFSAM